MNVIPDLDEQSAALTARGNQRRRDLLDAALRLLIRDGHHAVTLRSVSLEANASHGSINYYFGSRSALMCALTRQPNGTWEMKAIGTYHDGRTVKKLIAPAATALRN